MKLGVILWHSLTVSELRVVGRSEDGTKLELKNQSGSTFTVRISDHLRALVNQSSHLASSHSGNQTRLVAVSDDHAREAMITVKVIQARLRAGESAQSLSTSTGWSLEKIEKFSGPIMQERAYVIELALAAAASREIKGGPTLAQATINLLTPRGVELESIEWNTWRNLDGRWNIFLSYPLKESGTGSANWTFDIESRTLEPNDDGAMWISGEEKISRPNLPSHGIVFPSESSAPRLVAVREEIETVRITSKIENTQEEEAPADAKRDGVTKRLKIPSWDDIMFGSRSEEKPSGDKSE